MVMVKQSIKIKNIYIQYTAYICTIVAFMRACPFHQTYSGKTLSPGIPIFLNGQWDTLLHGQYIYHMLTCKIYRLSYICMNNIQIPDAYFIIHKYILPMRQCFQLSNFIPSRSNSTEFCPNRFGQKSGSWHSYNILFFTW